LQAQWTSPADMPFVCVGQELGKDMTWKALMCQHLGKEKKALLAAHMHKENITFS